MSIETQREVPIKDELLHHIHSLAAGTHGDPFAVLGPHQETRDGREGFAVRAFIPRSRAVTVVSDDVEFPAARLHADGFFEAWIPTSQLPLYHLKVENDAGEHYELIDPYSFSTLFSDMDLHLLGEGTHYNNYERLGAHVRNVHGVKGTSFAVWAPNAKRVSVVGDFNQWDGRRHSMRLHPGVGIWEIFIPNVVEGERYKFELVGADGRLLPLRTDPYGFYFEERPKTASLVHDINQYRWNDDDWLNERAQSEGLNKPINIYEVHLGSWIRNPDNPENLPSYRELAHKLVDYVKNMGFTHIELLPVSEHPFDGSWGYQTLGYFAPTSRFGPPEDFMYFVDHCHQNGIGVLVDWVPAHFPRDDHGLRHFDGTAIYEHADPRQGEHPDWGTQIFNYGRNEVANFLIGNALFWFEKYHIDGIRVDAVASMLYLDYGRNDGEWIPNQYGGNENLEAIAFLKRLNELIHLHYPGVITAAEESTSFAGVSRPTYLGGLGFSLKWNMGWMNDTLQYMLRDPVFRRFHQNDLTFSLVYAFSENFLLPLSHDEVVHGKGALLDKMPGTTWQRYANLRLLYAYMYTHPGKKLLFMGGEFGQWSEWRHQHSLDWHWLHHDPHKGIQALVRDLNQLVVNEPALFELDFDHTGFEWIDFHDADSSIISYLRRGKSDDDLIVVVCNFTPVPRHGYRVGVPRAGFYRERLNTDSSFYGGSNVGNDGGVVAEEIEAHGRPYSIPATIPPLGVVAFKAVD